MALLVVIFALYRNEIGKRLRLERDLARAVRKGQFEVHYQPQLLSTDAVIGAEALVRWRHPSGTLLSPDASIPLAKDSALICDLGLAVLRQGCDTLRDWSRDPATRAPTLAVNVSPVQLLDDEFLGAASALIHSSGMTRG
ncbi:EAL domain-containing protein [Stenotrophomonas sp. ATCM1_4]|uniref:EAL domain-containing protein n=1 Tax=Stenotrophomonas sp. ATCM1_4 TaxID=2259330 RepID=UPI0014042D0E|nr:EAL domain-containing protein [Stenotrophomonas sp. ATCM1_4]